MEQQGINPPFIVTDGLTKTYIRREKPEHGGITRLWRRETREVQALRDVSFRIGRGELVGLIGPNGAGKSTLVKLMTGILTPTSGSCMVDGRTPWAERKAHVRSLGAVFGSGCSSGGTCRFAIRSTSCVTFTALTRALSASAG
ncbi:MAG: ATP-binding cassette domain-containing protein [Christensenellales bacterium]